MKALLKLQGAIISQAAEHQPVVGKFNDRARIFVAVGALVTASVAGADVKVHSGPLTSSNCAVVGANAGAAVGYASKSAASYASAESTVVARAASKAMLSISERERLDGLSAQALQARSAWMKSLYNVDQARAGENRAGLTAALETESEARQAYESKRATFTTTVCRLYQGAGGEPRAVDRYLEVAAALPELDSEARVSYQMLQSRDEALQVRSQAYAQEVHRTAWKRKL